MRKINVMLSTCPLLFCFLSMLFILPMPLTVQAAGANTPTENTAVIVQPNPFAAASPVGYINESLTHAGYSVDYYGWYEEPVRANVSNLKTVLRAGVIYWRGHGEEMTIGGEEKNILSSSEYATVTETNQTEAEALYIRYKEDFDSKRVVWYNITYNSGEYTRCWVYITPSFITYYYGSNRFPNSLWYLTACKSLTQASSAMADAFLGVGGGAYTGWNGTVHVDYGDRSSKTLIGNLSRSGLSVDEEYSKIYVDPVGYYEAGKRYNASLKYRGAGDLRLFYTEFFGVTYGSFETNMKWQTYYFGGSEAKVQDNTVKYRGNWSGYTYGYSAYLYKEAHAKLFQQFNVRVMNVSDQPDSLTTWMYVKPRPSPTGADIPYYYEIVVIGSVDSSTFKLHYIFEKSKTNNSTDKYIYMGKPSYLTWIHVTRNLRGDWIGCGLSSSATLKRIDFVAYGRTDKVGPESPIAGLADQYYYRGEKVWWDDVEIKYLLN